MEKIFLTAEWQYLVMANYVIDPKILQPYLPNHVAIDFWQGKTYVSLVGFLFKNTKIMNFSIPFHKKFEEVNLRFYVRYKDNSTGNATWKRGVVFIREIVPLPTIAWTANVIYREPYITMPMNHEISVDNQELKVKYLWKFQNEWNELSVKANNTATQMQANSEAEFITEHYWGYTKWNNHKTAEYQVEHPKWDIFEVNDYHIQCNISELYGNVFEEVMQKPSSVLLAKGSDIVVRKGVFLK